MLQSDNFKTAYENSAEMEADIKVLEDELGSRGQNGGSGPAAANEGDNNTGPRITEEIVQPAAQNNQNAPLLE